jgi:hypothetical protein
MNAETPAGANAKSDTEEFGVVWFNAADLPVEARLVAVRIAAGQALALKAAVFKRWPETAVVAQVIGRRDVIVAEFRKP